MSFEAVYFLPLSRRGMGSGHLRRCFKTARSMEGNSSLVFDGGPSDALLPDDWKSVIPGFPGEIPVLLTSDVLSRDTDPGSSGTLAVFDRRSSGLADILPWTDFCTPVLLDDDGPARELAPFVVDTIPGPRGSAANQASPSLLNLPPRRRSPDPGGSILLSFGGEDPAGITIPLVRLLLERGIDVSRIHLTLPPQSEGAELPEGVRLLPVVDNLKEKLGNYGMVICSYGLTAWEAVSAGCAVITVDPTAYHASLSRSAGFPGSGLLDSASGRSLKKTEKKLKRLLDNPEHLRQSADSLSGLLESSSGETLAGLLESLDAPEARCLACGNPLPRVIERFPRSSYYCCPECGIIGHYRFDRPRNGEYGPSYFQEEYRNQYGKSYLEDFQAIRTMAVSRLNFISRRGKAGGTLLDIGCAYGPFLDAAREAGYRVYGNDISAEAVEYVRDSLDIPAISGAFPGESPVDFYYRAFGLETFDIITLWYVIEHFTDLKTVFRALNTLLPVDGVLAMSTPNGSGISARRSRRSFLENSPADHYSIWTPRSARRLLARYGFKVYKIRVTGHHPERFGVFSGSKVFQRLSGLISRIFSLGDTFEIYAVKESSLV